MTISFCKLKPNFLPSPSLGEITVMNEINVHKELKTFVEKKKNGSMSIDVPYSQGLHHGSASYKFVDTSLKIKVTNQRKKKRKSIT